jgi:phosphatidate cytidylyltransferase
VADSQSTFFKRVVSAVLGAAVVFSLCFWAQAPGVQIVCLIAVTLATREYSRMIFQHSQIPEHVGWLYRSLCLLLYVDLYFRAKGGRFDLTMLVFISTLLWITRGKTSNENLLTSLSNGIFGIVYCVVFPCFAMSLSMLDEGVMWFFLLMVIVFFGDTFAYFAGRWFGRSKLMVDISPNKTWAGAVGGLAGSSLGGVVFGSSIFVDVAWWKFLLFCIVCGAFAQSGDLLMSLVKRVCHVKDSGSLMPGHGGILDRLDGVFISCPLIYAFALWVRPF